MEHIDSDETKLLEVRRAPIGIILQYVAAGLILIAGFIIVAIALPQLGNLSSEAKQTAAILVGCGGVLVVLYLVVATTIYRESYLVVTDRNITQALQLGLFRRKVSQLSLANIEDVTSDQNGLIQSIFGYGTLKVETAGEQDNFYFYYCPRPNVVAKEILDARERYISRDPAKARRANPLHAEQYGAEILKDI